MDVKDSNGPLLNDRASVTLIKDLKVKGLFIPLKRGKMVKHIRLTSRDEEVDCRIDGSRIVFKAIFLKKPDSQPFSLG